MHIELELINRTLIEMIEHRIFTLKVPLMMVFKIFKIFLLWAQMLTKSNPIRILPHLTSVSGKSAAFFFVSEFLFRKRTSFIIMPISGNILLTVTSLFKTTSYQGKTALILQEYVERGDFENNLMVIKCYNNGNLITWLMVPSKMKH